MLWLIENAEQITLSDVAPLFPCLSEARREKLESFRHKPAAVQSVLAELLLRRALREEYGLTELPRVEAAEKGKPFFPDRPDVCFNLSHCKTAVACALDAAPVGVDVQEYRTICGDKHRLAAPPTDKAFPHIHAAPPVYRILSEAERAWVEAGESPEARDRRFTAVWTCKEAYGKARGTGIGYDLKSTRLIPQASYWVQYGWLFRCESRRSCALSLCASAPLALRTVGLRQILTAT